jgi:hypothetical protein
MLGASWTGLDNIILETQPSVGCSAVTVSAVEDRLTEVNGAPPIRQHWPTSILRYASWAQDHEEVDPIYEGDIPEGGLNGSYWK